MSDRANHLIERAAARLRDAKALHVPDRVLPGEEVPPPGAPNSPAPPGVDGGPTAPLPAFRPLVPPAPFAPLNPSTSDASSLPAPPPPLTRPAAATQAGQAAPDQTRTVPLDALERSGMVVARTSRTRISEEYRIAIGRILRVLHETAGKGTAAANLLMVTSARPGEGKTFSAVNLAGSIAQNGTEPVLLVDVDPKLRPLSTQIGLGDARGFLDLVAEPSLRPEEVVWQTAIPSLQVLPVGTRTGGTGQNMSGIATMRPIIPTITRLARRFPKHLIILDAPPCLSTSDPHTMAGHVGQVVLVVEAERTQRVEVESALDLVRACPTVTLLLNKVRLTTSHTFGAYDYFGSYT